MADNTVIVRGLPLTCNPVKVKLRFESECNVRIESIKVETDCAEVKLPNEEACKTFRDNLQPSIRFGNDEHSLTIVDQNEQPAASSTPTATFNMQSKTDWSFSRPQTWSSLRQMPDCKCGILVQPSSKTIYPVDIKKYFENSQLSYGGQIKTIISMIDGIFISFKDESVAERVWNFRPHRVDGKAVVVYLKSVPQTYSNRLVVTPCGDTKKLEELKRLLDQCSTKSLPTKVCKVCQSGAALITYGSDVDEKDVLHVVEEFRKRNPAHQISFLLRSDCILVENVPEDISEMEIRVLFENTKLTTGGNITRIDFLNKTRLLIYFTSYLDAERVTDEFRDKGLPVFGKELGIHWYSHNLHIQHKSIEHPNPADVDLDEVAQGNEKPLEKRLTNIKWISYKDVDPEVIRFLVKRPEHVSMLNFQLKKLAVGKVSQNGKELCFEMSESRNEKAVTLQVKKFLSEYTSMKCQITDDSTSQGIDSRLSSKDSQPEDDVCFRSVNNQKQELIISGLKAEVESFSQSLKQPSSSRTLRLKEEEIRWLLDTGVLDPLRKDHPAIMGCNGKNIVLSGNSTEISEASQAIHELVMKLKTELFITGEQDSMDFLVAAKTNENITINVSKLMKSKHLYATMVIKDGLPYIVGTVDISDTARAVLKSELALDESFEIASDKFASQLPVWRTIEVLESEGKIRTTFKDKVYSIVGFRTYVKEASEKLSWCDVKFRKLIQMESGAAEHIVSFVEDFRKLATRHSTSYEITSEGIILKGKKESIEAVGDTLHKWNQCIVKKILDVEKFGIVEFLNSNEGNDILSDVQKEFRSTVCVSSKPDTQAGPGSNGSTSVGRISASGKSSISIGPLTISVRQGDITEEKNDAIVNSVGHQFDLSLGLLSQAIASKGGDNIQSELNKCFENEIRLTSSGRLQCKKIFHVVFSHDSKKFSECLVKVLQEADKRKCTSISIPAVGTGTGHLSNHTIAKLMLSSFQEFVKKNANIKHLRTVDIVLFDQYQLTDFKLEILAGSTGPDTREPITTQPSTQFNNYSVTKHLPEGERKSLKVGCLSISVREGDITEENNHAIVNCTGPGFDLSNGMVSKAIIKKGGYVIQKEVQLVMGEDIRVTAAGKLKCIKIIHVVVPRNPTAIGKRIGDILETAEKQFCPSLSIPAIGTGNLKLPVSVIAKVMLQAIHEFVRKSAQTQCLRKVDFVIYSQKQVKEFQEAFFSDISSNRPEAASYDARPTGSVTDRAVLRIFSFEKDKAEKALEFLKQQIDIKTKGSLQRLTKAFAPQPPASGSFIWEFQTIDQKWYPFDKAVCQSLEKGYQRHQNDPSSTYTYVNINSKQQRVFFPTMIVGSGTEIRRREFSGRADELAIASNHFGDSRNDGAANSNPWQKGYRDPTKS